MPGDGCGSGRRFGAYSCHASSVAASDGVRRAPRKWRRANCPMSGVGSIRGNHPRSSWNQHRALTTRRPVAAIPTSGIAESHGNDRDTRFAIKEIPGCNAVALVLREIAHLERIGCRARIRVYRRADAARGSREAHSCGRAVRPTVSTVEGRRGGNGRARRERAARHFCHHLLRELHDELHYADRRDHRPPHRRRKGGNDDRARLHRVAVRCRWARQALPTRPGRSGEPRAGHDGWRCRDDARASRVRWSVRRSRHSGTSSDRIDRGHHVKLSHRRYK